MPPPYAPGFTAKNALMRSAAPGSRSGDASITTTRSTNSGWRAATSMAVGPRGQQFR